jgi:hypothetical protein
MMMSYFMVQLTPENMDPVSWASSNPALQLGLKYESTSTQPGQHFFSTLTNPLTVMSTLVNQDRRVSFAEIVRQEPVESVAMPSSPNGGPVPEGRPQPGGPEMQHSGYIPKMPGSNGGNLTWDEKAAAATPAGGAPPEGFGGRAKEALATMWWVPILWFLAKRWKR